LSYERLTATILDTRKLGHSGARPDIFVTPAPWLETMSTDSHHYYEPAQGHRLPHDPLAVIVS
jgi:hypothetical protein